MPMLKKGEISCCGLNCGKCVSYKGKYAKKAAEILNAIKESKMDEWHDKSPKEPKFSYEDFKKGLQWFSKSMICAGCHKSGAVPNCVIRICCIKKKIENCGKCPEFPCDTVKRFKENMGIDIVTNFMR
jgi:hypothetical protein